MSGILVGAVFLIVGPMLRSAGPSRLDRGIAIGARLIFNAVGVAFVVVGASS